MPKASVTRLINNRKDKLIEFVLDIEKYPEFVPFCYDAKIYENKIEGDLTKIIADLTIGKGPFKDTYKSDVRYHKKNDSIHVTNIGGPLKHLENNWKFIQNGMNSGYFSISKTKSINFCFSLAICLVTEALGINYFSICSVEV